MGPGNLRRQRRFHSSVALLLMGLSSSASHADSNRDAPYPRVMGMNIGAKHYDDPAYQAALSRLDVVILGFYPGWQGRHQKSATVRESVRAIKAQNPRILIGQYTVLSETQPADDKTSADSDKGRKLDKERWWLLDAKGRRVQWTDKYGAFEVNITKWARPDHVGERYPEWLARRDYSQYFGRVPEFDIWFFDNALSRPAAKRADWDGDGVDDAQTDARIATEYRKGHAAHWLAARNLYPKGIFIGNSDDVSSPEYSGRLEGVFLEALIGASWSMERWQGWRAVMERYRSAMKHTKSPHIVGFNVHGASDDYQKLRYGLASSLLDDGYFSYTDESRGYGSVVWFDEYDANLGMPVELPPIEPWANGVYRRNFQSGTVLVNPEPYPVAVTIEAGYRHIKGKQAPDVNDGSSVKSFVLLGKDGVILLKDRG